MGTSVSPWYWGVCSDGEEGGVLCVSDTLCPAMAECMFSAGGYTRPHLSST